MTICEQMVYAVEFLSGFRAGRKAIGKPVTRFDYVVYHLEGHLIRVHSVLDRALLLVNAVFGLGVPERECRLPTIAENSHVVDTPVAVVLRDICDATKPYRRQRNLVVHRQRYSEDALTKIEPYYILQKETAPPYALLQDSFYVYKTMTDEFIREKKDELTQLNQLVFSAVVQLFCALEPVLDSRYALLCDA